jgi:hypothetical protein
MVGLGEAAVTRGGLLVLMQTAKTAPTLATMASTATAMIHRGGTHRGPSGPLARVSVMFGLFSR